MAMSTFAARRGISFVILRTRQTPLRFSSSMTGLRNGELGGWRLPGGHETDLRIYNLCEKKKVKLITNRKNLVSWYTCGPTVYDSAHIGHACCYVKLDILRRILQDFLNLKVVMVMGVTDIDDKIIARANECNENFNVVSRQYEKEFFDDISSLGVLSPSKVGRVTDYIPEIICFVRKIVESGYGYSTSDGSVYFSVSSYPFYGKLVPTPEKNTLGCVLGTNEKRSPLDFALWKGAKLGEPSWNSPWGPGRPGWHIECSTIASILLGPNIDLHSGGVDLIFPHHENEEAQSCAYHDTKQWVNYWIHTGHLYLKGDVKMSKSLKNTISIKDFLSEYTSDDLRMFCLISPYRNGMEYSNETIKNAVSLMRRFEHFFSDSKAFVEGKISTGVIDEPALLQRLNETENHVMDALKDDFDTPKAISHLLHLISFTNAMLHKTPETVTGRTAFPVLAVSNYVQKALIKLGLRFDSEDCLTTNIQLHRVLDSALSYRSNIRRTALEITKSQSKEQQEIKTVLLKSSDAFRKDLLANGIDLKDHGVSSSWTNRKKNPITTDVDPSAI